MEGPRVGVEDLGCPSAWTVKEEETDAEDVAAAAAGGEGGGGGAFGGGLLDHCGGVVDEVGVDL